MIALAALLLSPLSLAAEQSAVSPQPEESTAAPPESGPDSGGAAGAEYAADGAAPAASPQEGGVQTESAGQGAETEAAAGSDGARQSQAGDLAAGEEAAASPQPADAGQQEEAAVTDADGERQETDADGLTADIPHGPAEVPPAKRPRRPDPEKTAAAAARDESAETFEENRNTLAYGTPAEINSLIGKMMENDDPRYADALYDLFQTARSVGTRQRIIEYFTAQKDPCLEDFAAEVLNDPYDEPAGIVEKVFAYVSAVEFRAVSGAVIDLLDSGDEAYFTAALSTLGKIGSGREAVYLAGYLDRGDLTLPQRQALMRTLGEMGAVETWDKLVEIIQDENENSFVRMYAAEAIGKMEKPESVPVLEKLFEDGDPNMRQYCIRGLSHYPENKTAAAVIVQGIRDEHYKVRIESIKAAGALDLKDAVPYLVYRAKNDPETAVKKECYPVLAELGTKEGEDFLIGQITDRKVSDSMKSLAAEALMKDGRGEKEIIELAQETLKDDRRKPLRYALGKQFAKYARPAYADICAAYVRSGDAATVSQGLDIYRNGRYAAAGDAVRELAEKKAGANRTRARKLLGLSDDDAAAAAEKPSADKKNAASDAR